MKLTAQEYLKLLQENEQNKFFSERVECDGIKFPSKLERNYYQNLKFKVQEKKIRYFLRQVRFDLKGKTAYYCDFMVVENDGTIRYIDTKGYETPVFKLKKKQVEAMYPIKIEVVKRCR